MIVRKPLRGEVQKEILARLVDQRLVPGSRVNESHLSAELGVSRTPLREAMLGLEAAGFLGSDVGRGFLVPPIVAGGFVAGQEVLAQLAPLALSLAPALAPPRVMELQNLLGRARLRLNGGPHERAADFAALPQRWSLVLLEACTNRILNRDVARLEALAVRDWRESLRRGFDPAAQLASFGALYEMLRAGDRTAAARAWSEHITRYSREAAVHLPAQIAKAEIAGAPAD